MFTHIYVYRIAVYTYACTRTYTPTMYIHLAIGKCNTYFIRNSHRAAVFGLVVGVKEEDVLHGFVHLERGEGRERGKRWKQGRQEESRE